MEFASGEGLPGGQSGEGAQGAWTEQRYDEFAAIVRRLYDEADEPINLARLSSSMIAEVGPVAKHSRWLGAGSFLGALRRVDLPGARFTQHHLWDPARHDEPAGPEGAAAEAANGLPSEISQFRQVTKLPAISSADWPRVYQSLSPTAEQIGSALWHSVLYQAETAELEPSADEKASLARWLGVDPAFVESVQAGE